jgi:uncharacterized protein YbjT (DUF2867 family)
MTVTAPVLVTGGTGTLGHLVVPRLRAAGCRVRVLSRRPRDPAGGVEFVVGDLGTGEGVDEAVAGVPTVVHCAGSAKGDEDKARTLVAAAARAGVDHIVNISVVGAARTPQVSRFDRTMFGYYGVQRAAEEVVAGSPVPWTTLRATQFYDLIWMVARVLTKSPVVPILAGFRFQPIDTDEVAERMVELALGPPAGLVPELGGPRVYGMDELIRSYLRAHGRRRLLARSGWPVPGPARCGPGSTWLPTGRSAAVRGRSSWPNGWARRHSPRNNHELHAGPGGAGRRV